MSEKISPLKYKNVNQSSDNELGIFNKGKVIGGTTEESVTMNLMKNQGKKSGMKLMVTAQDMAEFEETEAKKSSVIEDRSFQGSLRIRTINELSIEQDYSPTNKTFNRRKPLKPHVVSSTDVSQV